MRLILMLGLAMLCASTLQAQSVTSGSPLPRHQSPADSGAVLLFNGWYLPRYQPTGAEADTTGALLSMFRRQRRGGYVYTIPFIVGVSLSLPISTTDSYGQQVTAEKAIAPPLGVPILAGTIVGFILHANTYNKKHLLAVDQAYAAGQPIPAKYRRRLKPVHFEEAAQMRMLLREQMEYDQRHPQAQVR
ncbi:hypothetical protein MUN82_14570 [Hymenobacter aerilatus]|uniref:Transmembrane protein n=1 Tax=Hymenobacter aerilatus TaxID=2932251 RepID=A0A8T9SQT6_9BACT|nr:hypothetical protein [Hymenobacter aerilatus]UOR04165.1 hypothetical protein MUN82_14570 [Hymenobacter aerilatus]